MRCSVSTPTKSDESKTATPDVTRPAANSAKPATRPDPNAMPKLQPPYAVIILNDPVHSFEYVIDVLQRVFGHARQRAAQLTLQAHLTGRAMVWTGSFEVAEFKRDRIRAFGPDIHALHGVNFPLGCEIEPLMA